MSTSRQKEITEVLYRLYQLGFNSTEAQQLRGIAMTFSRWDEHECNGEIERDEATGKPFRRTEYQSRGGSWKVNRYPLADREAGAQRRLDAILAAHPELAAYRQGDPRGCSVYIYRAADLTTGRFAGHNIESVYNSVGVAVY